MTGPDHEGVKAQTGTLEDNRPVFNNKYHPEKILGLSTIIAKTR